MLSCGAEQLEKQKKAIDALNVFPVPDGDTGTNMNLTYRAAYQSAEKVATGSVHDVAAAASMGSLMGARGNSGVILSQILRGIAKGLEGMDQANALQLAQALQTGVDTAYKAVMRPIEGTILTVSRETAKGAYNKAKSGESDILQVLKAGLERGEATLAKTPDMLPVLKQAGVVDAGGKGFLTIISGWIAALEGKVPEAKSTLSDEVPSTVTTGIVEVGTLDFPYCTEFLVKGNDLEPEKIKQGLIDKGDSLLVVGTSEVVKIHIHTKNPGLILDYAVKLGTLHEVQIHNMLAQNEAAAHQAKEEDLSTTTVDQQEEQLKEQLEEELDFKEYGIVAVAMGEGIAEIFSSLGVEQVVFGGQTMNPSTSDLAEAVLKVKAKNVFILPNNGNIIMAASQVNEVVDKQQVYVIPTKSIPQAISALLAFNSDNLPEENVEAMTEALKQVVSGEVTYAVRDSQFGNLEIAEGDILGLIEDKITTTGRDVFEVAKKVLENMNWREKDIVTIFYGKDMAEEEVNRLSEWLESEKPDIEVEIYAGRQPLYYYILGVE
ncbi:MAG: DAK2 domain-containing protein [Peptococcaceae bacterium]|nr:DAK2 domain-containing protein [Peptococcaceae bacterium]